MLQPMLAVTKESEGSVKIVEGDFQSSASVPTEVHDIGFKPDYLYIMPTSNLTKPYYAYWIYFSDIEELNFQCVVTKSSGAVSYSKAIFPSTDTVRGGLYSVDDNGFTFSAVTGNANYPAAPSYHYRAIKWS